MNSKSQLLILGKSLLEDIALHPTDMHDLRTGIARALRYKIRELIADMVGEKDAPFAAIERAITENAKTLIQIAYECWAADGVSFRPQAERDASFRDDDTLISATFPVLGETVGLVQYLNDGTWYRPLYMAFDKGGFCPLPPCQIEVDSKGVTSHIIDSITISAICVSPNGKVSTPTASFCNAEEYRQALVWLGQRVWGAIHETGMAHDDINYQSLYRLVDLYNATMFQTLGTLPRRRERLAGSYMIARNYYWVLGHPILGRIRGHFNDIPNGGGTWFVPSHERTTGKRQIDDWYYGCGGVSADTVGLVKEETYTNHPFLGSVTGHFEMYGGEQWFLPTHPCERSKEAATMSTKSDEKKLETRKEIIANLLKLADVRRLYRQRDVTTGGFTDIRQPLLALATEHLTDEEWEALPESLKDYSRYSFWPAMNRALRIIKAMEENNLREVSANIVNMQDIINIRAGIKTQVTL